MRPNKLKAGGANKRRSNTGLRSRNSSTTSSGANTRTRSQSLSALRKKRRSVTESGRSRALSAPERSTPAQRQERVNGLNSQIEAAKSLPPQKASFFLRAAYALRQAILNLGSIKDRSGSDSEAIDQVKKSERDLTLAGEQLGSGLDFVESADKSAQTASDGEQTDTQENLTPSSSSIDNLKRKPPEELSAQELADGILEVQSAIEQGVLLLPANASPLLRALYTLKKAIFDLANVDRKLGYRDRDDLVEKIEAQLSNGRDLPEKTKRDLTRALEALADQDKA